MKKFLFGIVAILCLVCMLGMVACDQKPSNPQPTEPTAQEVFDAAAADMMPDYTFAYIVDSSVAEAGEEDGAQAPLVIAPAPDDAVDEEAAIARAEQRTRRDDVTWTSALLAKKTGDADKYILCTDEDGNESLVYVYTDICYDPGSVYRYIDVYTPTDKGHLDPDTPVFLYLHGGGWIAGSRKDEDLSLVPYLVKAGFVVISLEYGLWFGMNQRAETPLGVYSWHDVNVSKIIDIIFGNEHPVSVYDMMDDIETCLTFLKQSFLPELGLNATKIGIGGYSAGGHLSSLYAYKYNQTAPSGKAAPLEIAFELDLVGPVRLLDEGYLHVVGLVLGKDADGNSIETDDLMINMVLDMITSESVPIPEMLQGILGYDKPVNIATDEGWHLAETLIAEVQGYSFLCETSVPTVICYAKQHPENVAFMESIFPDDFDLFVPITVYRSMSAKLDEVGIVHADHLFEYQNHNTIGGAVESCQWMATQCRAMAQIYCE